MFLVDYSDNWQGHVSIGTEGKSISGQGLKRIPVDNPQTISGNAQKRDGSDRRLRVAITADGERVTETQTTAPYGVVQISHTF